MQINPYLFFNGTCEAAMTRYAQVLGGEIEMMMRTDDAPSDMPMPPEMKGKIMHACIRIGDRRIMASDAPAARYNKPQGFDVQVEIGDFAKAESVFAALSEGGTVNMPFAKTFWAKGFGACVDRFGTPWMVNCP